MDKSLKIQMLEALTDSFKNAQQRLNEFKAQLPDNLKGFVDLQMDNLKKAHKELAADIDLYANLGRDDDSIKLKNFKIHCGERFLPIVILSEPERIKSYGITFDEYKSPYKGR